MDSRTAATGITDPDAVEFVRFCYRRRRVSWPELYDEMCGVAARGLYQGIDYERLATLGVGFSLGELPRLACLAQRVVAEERLSRTSRPGRGTAHQGGPGSARPRLVTVATAS